jgi:ABC-2 type transport system ATP-binding protein
LPCSFPAIRISNLSRTFGPLTAVDRLNLEIMPGEIFGLVGPDGAGKTTTLRLLCGLLEITEGQIEICGHDVTRELDAVKDRIGYMAQRFGLYVDLTVEENMLFYAELFGISRRERESLMARLLKMTRMDSFRHRAAGKLSGGMKQKLALMCSLLHHPEVLFLDEPTNGVDPVSRRDFWAILYQLVKDGLTVVVTTAYLDEAERCNRVGLMHQGRLIRCAPPDQLKDRLAGICYEVRAPNQRGALELLKDLPDVLSVEPSGASLHIFLSPTITTPEGLIKAMESNGLGPIALERIAPSLEDAFIALIREAGRNGNGDAASSRTSESEEADGRR